MLQNLCTYFLCVTDPACIEPRICTTHGLYLKSQGKKKLAYLTAKQVSCGNVASMGCIHVVIHVTALSLSALTLIQPCICILHMYYIYLFLIILIAKRYYFPTQHYKEYTSL